MMKVPCHIGVMSQPLRREGYELRVARDTAEASHVLERFEADLILVDIDEEITE